MDIAKIKLIYFLGIGGIGMSALARYFNHYKIKVAGYDKTETALTKELNQEGIAIHYTDDKELLQSYLGKTDKQDVLIVYTPAIPRDHNEYKWLLQNGYTIKKRSQVLGDITRQFKTIAVAGTHGKTTTSSLIAHLLKTAGIDCYAFLGGITKNYNSNLLLGKETEKDKTYVVVEADEYDRSFLTLHPDIAVITSVDADHLDIYGDIKFMHESYTLFSKQVKSRGTLIVKKNVDKTLTLDSKRFTYDVTLKSDYTTQNVRIENGNFMYDVVCPVGVINDVQLGLPGLHNVENSIAAVVVARQLGISDEHIKKAFCSFQGVKRRFDYRVKKNGVVYVDDYAHHPEELKAAIGAARQLYPDKKITGIFQPHLFSRTRDFADGFAESLDMLDETILLDIYPARELPIEGVNSQMLLDKMKSRNKVLLKKTEVLDYIGRTQPEVLMTLGAGDIDTLVEPLEKLLAAR